MIFNLSRFGIKIQAFYPSEPFVKGLGDLPHVEAQLLQKAQEKTRWYIKDSCRMLNGRLLFLVTFHICDVSGPGPLPLEGQTGYINEGSCFVKSDGANWILYVLVFSSNPRMSCHNQT